METFLQDVKQSLRMFRQSPGFTAAAVAALTLGIGTNTAIFSVVNAVLLKPAPFPDADRLVMFMNTSPQGSGAGASPAKFQHWREQTAVVQDVSAFRNGVRQPDGWRLAGADPIRAGQARTTSGSSARDRFRGRTFTPEEDLPDGGKVVVLSHGFWNRRFAADPEIIGKTISLGGDPHVVIGIIGARFRFPGVGDRRRMSWCPFNWIRTPRIRATTSRRPDG